jgi:hypothetical protein
MDRKESQMKKVTRLALCSLIALATVAIAGAQERAQTLSPEVLRVISDNLKPFRNQAFVRPEAADLMVHPIQIEVISKTPARASGKFDVRFRIIVPVTNLGRTAMRAGTVVNLLVEDTYSAGRFVAGGRLSASRRLPVQSMDQTESLVATVLQAGATSETLAKRYHRILVQLAPVNTIASRTFHDANDANNTTAEISGEEFVRQLGL